jgi:hypothetical protein
MGLSKNVTMSLWILLQKTVDEHADAVRKAVDTQERGDTTP